MFRNSKIYVPLSEVSARGGERDLWLLERDGSGGLPTFASPVTSG
jgi:hypothetical protein